MGLMEENDEGNMEFPRDLMEEDCFSGGQEPLYGFVTNVTIPEDMLQPCIVDVECNENGTSLNVTKAVKGQEHIIDTLDFNSSPLTTLDGQGISKY